MRRAREPPSHPVGEHVYTFTIQSLVKTRPWINGIESHLDSPVVDTFATPRFCLSLQGWVGSDNERITNIWLAWRGSRIADAKIFPRADVETLYPGKRHVAGFYIDAVPLLFGEDEPLKVILDTEDGRSSSVFEMTLRFAAASASLAPANNVDDRVCFAPILALARSGTTFLSSLLNRNDGVLGDDEYPYETRLGVHLANEWFVSMQPRFYEPHATRNSQSMDQNLLAMLKILKDEHGVAAARLAAFFDGARRHYRDKIVDLYRMLSPRPTASVIIEKIGLNMELKLLDGLFNTKPIFLIRDPRDVLMSMRVFNERRGIYEFHQAHAKNFGELLFSMSANLMQLVANYDGYAGEKILVRYEDLMRDPVAVLQQVQSFIGIAGSTNDAARAVEKAAVHREHVTAASPAASIGRWQNELTPSEQTTMNWFLQPFLSRFGY